MDEGDIQVSSRSSKSVVGTRVRRACVYVLESVSKFVCLESVSRFRV